MSAAAAAVSPVSLTGCTQEPNPTTGANELYWTGHRRERDYLAHPGRSGSPKGWDDLHLVNRLQAAYKRTFSYAHYGDGLWRQFFETRHKKLHEVFMSGDANAAAMALRDPAASDLHYGFENTFSEFTNRIAKSASDAAGYAALCKMHLVTLAEAFGMIRVENPEHYLLRPNSPPGPETETLLALLDRALGMEVPFPNPFPNEFGLQTARGVAGSRAIPALYQAYRIRALWPRSVVEIGGGMGRTAYYCFLLGLRDYTIVDLPFTALSHGYFLGRVLGEEAIVLDGEPYRQDAIKLQSPDTFFQSEKRHDLFVNIDSLTEIPRATAEPYYEAFRRRGTQLLSINHEANSHTVHGDLEGIAHSRFPYWMRRGYVEELFTRGRPDCS